ncbi:MAG TPA: STAS domain-containing protein [Candidatus Baltobacteraceae bacterium]|nr:STAS domain-containing protein [Candidatus Baltobacteraceae bacterium]
MVISLSGDLECSRQAEVAQTLRRAAKRAQVVLDLSDVRYVDSSFVATMIRLRKLREAKGLPPQHIAGAHSMVTLVLDIFHLRNAWPMFDKVDDAISAFWR